MKPFLGTYRIEVFCFLLTLFSVTGVWQKALDKQVREKGIEGYSVMKLELPANADSAQHTLQAIDTTVGCKELVRKNLTVDYFFMPGVYLTVAMWLLLIRRNTKKWLMVSLTTVAILQLVAWALDINENNHLLAAVNSPAHELGMTLAVFKSLVRVKFIIVLGGALFALLTCIFKRYFRG